MQAGGCAMTLMSGGRTLWYIILPRLEGWEVRADGQNGVRSVVCFGDLPDAGCGEVGWGLWRMPWRGGDVFFLTYEGRSMINVLLRLFAWQYCFDP